MPLRGAHHLVPDQRPERSGGARCADQRVVHGARGVSTSNLKITNRSNRCQNSKNPPPFAVRGKPPHSRPPRSRLPPRLLVRRMRKKQYFPLADVSRRRLRLGAASRCGRARSITSAISTRSRAASTASSYSGTSARRTGRSRRASTAMSASRAARTARRFRSSCRMATQSPRPDREGRRRYYPLDHRRRPHRSDRRSRLSVQLPRRLQLLERGVVRDQLHRGAGRRQRQAEGPEIATVYHDSPYGKETQVPLAFLAKKYGFEDIQIPVPHPGNDQSTQWARIRELKPDWVFLRGWGVMTPVAIKTAAKTGFPVDHIIGGILVGIGGRRSARRAGRQGLSRHNAVPGGRRLRDPQEDQGADR